MKEIWNLYTKERKITDLLHVRGNIIPTGYYHIVVEIWTIIGPDKILLTQRHQDKHYGLLWECTGGSIIQDENSIDGAVREVKEEIGLIVDDKSLELIHEYISHDTIYDVYVNYQDKECLGNIELQEEEVIDVKCVNLAEFNELHRKGEIVPKLSYLNDLIANDQIHLTTVSRRGDGHNI